MSQAPVLMVQGTASSVGKSAIVAGLCRLLARRGLHVAPFKAQNMSNNAAVCPDGGEIGRAQYVQALAAGVEPSVDMNPILLKPQGASSQVVVRGQVWGSRTAAEYFRASGRAELWPVVTSALDRLRQQFDVVIAEGAGSPAEINLRDRDLVNMSVALYAEADVVLVGDIDRGGVFASLLGTWEWLSPNERSLVRGFILNKFRGDASLLEPAPHQLEQRTGVPVLGVIPFLDDLGLPDEDAASLFERHATGETVQIAVVRYPHLANFDEFGPLSRERGVEVVYATRREHLRAPDLVILPGSKATIADLQWLRERGLANRIGWLLEHDTPVLGICGGLQMLGQTIHDPHRTESTFTHADGLGLLPLHTQLTTDKRLIRTRGVARGGPGIWQSLAGVPVQGYEIHTGRSHGHLEGAPLEPPLLELEAGPDGLIARAGLVAGTYVHGLLESPAPRRALIRALAARRGLRWEPAMTPPDTFNRLADALESSLRLDLPALQRAGREEPGLLLGHTAST
jgi:adenosylcobyric acid synthase